MISLGQDEIAKYPFLAEAGQYLKDKGFTLEQFASDPDLQMIVDKAYERIKSAAEEKTYYHELDDPNEKDLYSYGCESKVLQLLKLPDGTVKVLIEGLDRVKIIELSLIHI